MRYSKGNGLGIGLAVLAGLLAAGVCQAQDYNTTGRAENYARANAQYSVAQRDSDRAMRELIQQRQSALSQEKASPQYQAQRREVDGLFAAYKVKKDQVAGDLTKSDPKYRELLRQRDDAQAQIESARRGGGTGMQAFNDLYNKKAVYTSQLKKMEDDAMEMAGGASIYRQWQEATKTLEAMDAKLKADVENVSSVANAKSQAAQAQKTRDQVGVDLAGSAAAYREANYRQNQEDYYRNRAADYIERYSPYSGGWSGNYRGW